MFSEIGPDCHIETPLHANWGGKNVHIGAGATLTSIFAWLMMWIFTLAITQ